MWGLRECVRRCSEHRLTWARVPRTRSQPLHGSRCTIGVRGALAISTQDAMALAVEKDLAVTVTGEHKSTAKKLEIEIEDEAVIKVGSAKLTLKKNGDISIEGGKITVKGSGDVVIKGSKVAMN